MADTIKFYCIPLYLTLVACSHAHRAQLTRLAVQGQDYRIFSTNNVQDRRFGLGIVGTSEGTICVTSESWPRYDTVRRSRGSSDLSIGSLEAKIKAILPDGSKIDPREPTRTNNSFIGSDHDYYNSLIRLNRGAALTVGIPYEYFDADEDTLMQVVNLSYEADMYFCD